MYGVDWSSPAMHATCMPDEDIPETPALAELLVAVSNKINPLAESCDFGRDLYEAVITLAQQYF